MLEKKIVEDWVDEFVKGEKGFWLIFKKFQNLGIKGVTGSNLLPWLA